MRYRVLQQLSVVLLQIFLVCQAYAQVAPADTTGLGTIKKHRAERDAEFKDKDQSPLTDKDRKKFKGLKYYDIDLAYRVKGRFTKNASPVLFQMPTTSTRQTDYVKYGEIEFELAGQTYHLSVYQSQRLKAIPQYEDYLFIPFTDLTTGTETYTVGRYIDFRIPKDETGNVILDFNLCYHPSCAYGKPGYSCPIPPAENNLAVKILAGEKNYKKEGAAH